MSTKQQDQAGTDMMDHALAARDRLAAARIEAERWDEHHQRAQVHATLALMEETRRLADAQERAAGALEAQAIISLAQARVAPGEMPPLRHLAMVPRGEHDHAPSPRLARLLGLDEGARTMTGRENRR